MIEQFAPETIFLDYDLAPGISTEPIARLLAEMRYGGQIFVHTENPFGQQVLSRILPCAVVIPFGQFEIRRCV